MQKSVKIVMYQHDLITLLQEAACFWDPVKPSCTDLLLTNSESSYNQTDAFPDGLLHFQKLVISVLKTYILNNESKEVFYKDRKCFDNACFSIKIKLMFINIRHVEWCMFS